MTLEGLEKALVSMVIWNCIPLVGSQFFTLLVYYLRLLLTANQDYLLSHS